MVCWFGFFWSEHKYLKSFVCLEEGLLAKFLNESVFLVTPSPHGVSKRLCLTMSDCCMGEYRSN